MKIRVIKLSESEYIVERKNLFGYWVEHGLSDDYRVTFDSVESAISEINQYYQRGSEIVLETKL